MVESALILPVIIFQPVKESLDICGRQISEKILWILSEPGTEPGNL
jgi:hypothetical protein